MDDLQRRIETVRAHSAALRRAAQDLLALLDEQRERRARIAERLRRPH